MPLRERRKRGHAFGEQRLQVDRLAHRRAIRFGAGEREQLLGEARRTRHAILEIGDRLAARRVVLRTGDELRLDLHGRERRAQFVRGIGHEAFCVSSAAASRASRPFSARTSGCTSSGRRLSGSGSSASGRRASTARVTRPSGAASASDDHPHGRAEERQQHDQRPGVRSATFAASRLRTDSGCASCTTLSPTIAPYTRHSPRSVRSVEKPSPRAARSAHADARSTSERRCGSRSGSRCLRRRWCANRTPARTARTATPRRFPATGSRTVRSLRRAPAGR